jgi:hypothetical protein
MENDQENEFISIISLKDISTDNVFFTDKTNNIIMDGTFMKIIYSTDYSSYNGIYVESPFIMTEYDIEKKELKYNPYIENNRNLVDFFSKLEEDLMWIYAAKYQIQKTPQYCLRGQLVNGFFRIRSSYSTYVSSSSQFILKISGIWETEATFGISYKIMIKA